VARKSKGDDDWDAGRTMGYEVTVEPDGVVIYFGTKETSSRKVIMSNAQARQLSGILGWSAQERERQGMVP
jgi:hypothetical protein